MMRRRNAKLARNAKLTLTLAATAATLSISSAIALAQNTVDGVVSTSEYANRVLQNNYTGYGNNFNEINSANWNYSVGGPLELALPGNLSTGNGLVIFIDSKTGGGIADTVGGAFGRFGSIGGQHVDDWGTDVDGGDNIGATPGGGSILAPNFNPDYAIEINHYQPNNRYYTHIIDLTQPNDSTHPNKDYYLGENTPRTDTNDPNPALLTQQTYSLNGGTITHAYDHTNTLGVDGTDASGAGTSDHGFEFSIDDVFLGHSNGQAVRFMAVITNDNGEYLANQFLPGLGGGIGNLDNASPGSPLFDARGFALADQFYLTAFTPTAGAGGTWSTMTFTGGAVPNGAEQAAVLNAAGSTSVTLDSAVVLGYLNIDSAGGYTFTGGSLTFNGGSGAAILLANGGNQTINSPVSLVSDTRVNVSSGAVILGNGLGIAANKSLVKTGTGALTIAGTQTNGAGSTINLDAGAVTINADLGSGAGQPNVSVAGFAPTATAAFTTSQNLRSLTVSHNGTATLSGTLTTPQLRLNGNAAINGAGSIILDPASNGGSVTDNLNGSPGTGPASVNVPISITGDVFSFIDTGHTIALTAGMSLAAGKRITKGNDGTLIISGAQSNGAASSIANDAGLLVLNSDIGTGLAGANRPDLYVSASGFNGKATINSSQHLDDFVTADSGVATLSAGNNKIVVTNNFGANTTGKVNITDNKILVKGGTLGTATGGVYNGVTHFAQTGRNGGTWDGPGLISSDPDAAALIKTVAVAKADDIGRVGSSFGSETLATGDIMVMYTYAGDTNLDGRINGDDYFRIDSNVGSATPNFSKGDLDYNGRIDGDDYFLIDHAYVHQTGVIPASGLAGASAVPEPASFGTLTALSAIGLLRRRRGARIRV